jgi:hypothetical protein
VKSKEENRQGKEGMRGANEETRRANEWM